MKRRGPFFAAAILGLACTLPGGLGALSRPTATPTRPAETSTPAAPPSATPVPPTARPPSPTPLSPVIGVDTIGALSIFVSFGQGETLRTLAFSPDGSALASAAGNNEDFAVRLWETGSGLPLRVLQGHTSIVWSVAFSPDGQFLASASSDGTAKVWDWRTGSLLKSLDFPNEVVSVVFSPDSQTMAVGGVDGWPNATVWTWSVASWQPLMELSEFWNIPALAYSPDGQWLVGGGTSRNVRVWSTGDSEPLFTLHHSGQVSSVAISPDGTTAAAGLCEASAANAECTRGAVWLWDLRTGTLIEKLSDFSDGVEDVAFSVDGSWFIGGSRDGMLRAYRTSGVEPILVVRSPGGIGALALSPDGRFLATGSARGEIHLWRIEP